MPDLNIKTKEDFPVDLKKVEEVSRFLDEIKKLVIAFFEAYKPLTVKERSLVGQLACAISSPWGLKDSSGEFDAFIGDIFKIKGSITRLMFKMDHPPVPKGARMPSIRPAANKPSILRP